MQPIARGVGLFVAVLSVIVLLSALAGVGASILHAPPVWFMLGFELVIAVAAAFGVLIGMGKFADGPALGLLCVAGAIAVGSRLGALAGEGNLGINLSPFLLARLAAAGAIAGAGGLAVLSRRPRASWPTFAAGLACGVAFAGLAGAAYRGWDRLASLGTVAGAVVGLVGGVLLIGLLAAAVHLLVGAFEAGAVDDEVVAAGSEQP